MVQTSSSQPRQLNLILSSLARSTLLQRKLKLQEVFFFKQKTAYEMSASLVGSEMCIRDRYQRRVRGKFLIDEMVVKEAGVKDFGFLCFCSWGGVDSGFLFG
eukprot:TRINITY_DN3529_c0_g1_i1.p1 TRINITY_DN3529_c0_g1~~TRINITY_DN3529_c0_g1_i1.p1  ORF type:complete len:102 (+),score=25.43 TRINITY_DN3529_c0_g1_i1:138-443(+)